MTPQPAPPSQLNELQRLSGVLLDPKAAFTDIAARPRWWVPVLLLIAASLVFTWSYSHRVGWEGLIQKQLEGNAQFQQVPAEQRARTLERAAGFAAISGYAGAVLGAPLSILVMAGIFTMVFKVFLGARIEFRQIFAIVAYAMMLGLITSALAILVMYLKPPDDFDIRNPLAFNVGAFLSSETPKWLKAIASSIDLFSFWTMALLAVGFSSADRKLGFGRAFTWVAVCWAVWVLGKTAVTAMFA